MNKIKLIGLVLLTVSLGSCNDFLTIDPPGQLPSSSYMNVEEQAEQAVSAMYGMVRYTTGSGPDGNWVDHHHEFFTGSVNSDDAEKGSIPSDMPNLLRIIDYTANSSNSLVTGWYLHGWWGISQANYVLGHVPDSELPQATKDRMIGEAHFFKAYNYWMLLRHFGGVPILEHSVTTEEFGQIPRATYTETADYILQELQLAIDLLPERSGYPAAQLGRVTKGAARAYMARIMMFRLGVDPGSHSTTWQNVVDVTNTIINSGEYSLHSNYAELHEEYVYNTSESIFEIQAVAGSGGIGLSFWNVQASRTSQTGTMTGWGFHNPTQNLVDEFEEGDPRLSSTVYGIGYNNNTLFGITRQLDRNNQFTNYHFKKTTLDRRPSPGSGKQWLLMRYADVLLMNAEANYMIGNEAAARAALNQVRTRARNSSYTRGYNLGDPTGYPRPASTAGLLPDVTASGQALLDAIWHERRVEFAGEDLRTWDLIRTGRLVERVELVKDFMRDPSNPIFMETGTVNAEGEIVNREPRIQGIRTNIINSSLTGKDGRPIPVFPIPDSEIIYWNLDPNPGN